MACFDAFCLFEDVDVCTILESLLGYVPVD